MVIFCMIARPDPVPSPAAQLQLDAGAFLNNNDSYTFFDALGDLFKTGPTNTNMMDVRIIVVY